IVWSRWLYTAFLMLAQNLSDYLVSEFVGYASESGKEVFSVLLVNLCVPGIFSNIISNVDLYFRYNYILVLNSIVWKKTEILFIIIKKIDTLLVCCDRIILKKIDTLLVKLALLNALLIENVVSSSQKFT
ncbi:hypothetical protein ACJX0J_039741, partial [Zea mays]